MLSFSKRRSRTDETLQLMLRAVDYLKDSPDYVFLEQKLNALRVSLNQLLQHKSQVHSYQPMLGVRFETLELQAKYYVHQLEQETCQQLLEL